RELHRLGARGEHDGAEMARRAVIEGEPLRGRIESRNSPAEQQLHAEIVVVRAGVQWDPLLGRTPREIVFGKIRPVVRRLLVAIDQRDLPAEPEMAQLFCGAVPRGAGAHDGDGWWRVPASRRLPHAAGIFASSGDEY